MGKLIDGIQSGWQDWNLNIIYPHIIKYVSKITVNQVVPIALFALTTQNAV